jgi:hypothetical protein
LAYFEAIEAYGAEKIMRSNFEKDSEFTFIQKHLIGCVKEKNTQMFGVLMQIIYSKPDSHTGFTIPLDRINKIIHFKTDTNPDSIFNKTALNWAIENNDEYMVVELLKLEHTFHQTEEDGLECLRDNLSSHELLPWVFETYSKFYNRTQCCSSLIIVLVELVLLSYLPYFMDIYFDITLANSYKIYSSENFSVAELWTCGTCGEVKLNSSCHERIYSDIDASYHREDNNLSNGFEDIQNYFRVAFLITIFLLSFTVGFYILCIAFYSNPEKPGTSGKSSVFFNFCPLMTFCSKILLVCVKQLCWPLIHCRWQLLYLASPKRSQYKEHLAKSTAVWKNIKIVENGLESSLQLLLQMWLLRPFVPIIMTWSYTELISRCVSGFANFFSFGIHPACYIEKALFKILLTIIFLSLSLSLIKRKPGQDLLKTSPMFISIFAQTVGRMVALNSLVLMTATWGYYKYVLFFIIHFLLVFLIKIVFEVKSLLDKIAACFQSQGWRKRIWKVIKFITSGISSTIVMIHLNQDKEDGNKKHPTLLSHSAFQIIILFENLLLVSLPFHANGEHYPPDDCFPASSKYKALGTVIVAWVVGVVAQSIHYKFGSPLSRLNGPSVKTWSQPSETSCLATLCWKNEIEKIEMKQLLGSSSFSRRVEH